jgi:GNAT superfamily N-acetyltransferase
MDIMIEEFFKDSYCISTDPSRLDVETIHSFLSKSYWAEGIPVEVIEKSIEHSICYGVYQGEEQVGFARVITDYSTFGYIADVFVLERHRGKGLSKWLMECILIHPELQRLRRWMLVTRDAQGLYRQYGFKEVDEGSGVMERRNPDVYKKWRESG